MRRYWSAVSVDSVEVYRAKVTSYSVLNDLPASQGILHIVCLKHSYLIIRIYHYSNHSASTMMSSESPAQPKTPRQLACKVCKQRKKKCDRQSPCNLCQKVRLPLRVPCNRYHDYFMFTTLQLNIPCIPSTPAPPRKRRQRTKEMLDRLERFEQLLLQLTNGPPPQRSSSEATESTITTAGSISREQPPACCDRTNGHCYGSSYQAIRSDDFELRPQVQRYTENTGDSRTRLSFRQEDGT